MIMEKQMKRKRSYVINKRFQYGKSIRVVGTVTVLLAIIIIVVGIMISINNKKTAENNRIVMSNIDNIKKILDLQQSIYLKFSMIPTGVDQKTFSGIAIDLTKDYNASTRNLNASSTANEAIIKSNNKIITTNTYLIIAVIIITLSGLGILFVWMIRHTHRIAGPIYLMTLYGNEVIKGGKPQMRNLRNKDEFEDFYNLFRQLCEKIIESNSEKK